MQPWRLRNLPITEAAGHRVPVAVNRRSRTLGLALLERGRAGPGLLLPSCRSVHTFGMRFALDLFFLDADRRVLHVRRGVRPGRFAFHRRAAAVLELPSWSARGG